MRGACGNEAVDSQHGTGVDGSSHLCTSKRLYFNHICVKYCCLCSINAFCAINKFSPLQVKNMYTMRRS